MKILFCLAKKLKIVSSIIFIVEFLTLLRVKLKNAVEKIKITDVAKKYAIAIIFNGK